MLDDVLLLLQLVDGMWKQQQSWHLAAVRVNLILMQSSLSPKHWKLPH